jgi:hypothetical protein
MFSRMIYDNALAVFLVAKVPVLLGRAIRAVAQWDRRVPTPSAFVAAFVFSAVDPVF